MVTKKIFIRSMVVLVAGLFGMSLLVVNGASAAALTTPKGESILSARAVSTNQIVTAVITSTTAVTPTTAEAAPAEDLPPFMLIPQVPGPCGDISHTDFTGIPGALTAIASTEIVPATATSPEYCKVTGVIAPQIQFELDLPTSDWNGRYLQVGCGGYCGNVNGSEECTQALGQDYAVGFDNSGHVGAGFGDGSAFWALNEPGLRADFGYLSEHKMSLAAKAIIDAFYGKSVEYAYFQACSNGGRQALQLAQRWPTDFNGIIAGAPAAFQAPLNGLYHAWNATVDQDDQGHPILTADKLPLIHKAVLAQCGQQDGLDEPYLTDPRACDFKPESLLCQPGDDPSRCLTEAQVTVLKKIYSGPVDAQGQHLYIGGMPMGTELKWAGGAVPSDSPMNGMEESIASGYLKYLAFKDSPDPSTFNLENWTFTVDSFNSLREMGSVYNATNPNLAPFRDAGGKLILYHGWADDSIPPLGTITYYQAVQDKMGGLEATQEFARLFMVPGMYHCSGGPGASSFNMLAAIEDWVENGVAPEKIIATQYAGNQQGGGFANPTEGGSSGGEVLMTRPLFPYPLAAQYDGQGDPTQAESFVPVTTPGGADGHYDWVGNDLFQ